MAMTNTQIATSLIAGFPEKGDVLILISFYSSKCCWICKSNLQNITHNFQIVQYIFEALNYPPLLYSIMLVNPVPYSNFLNSSLKS
jgi:hypothetical protein